MRYTDKSLLNKIDEKNNILSSERLDLASRIIEILETEANSHSDALELENENLSKCEIRRIKKQIYSHERKTLKNLKAAWAFAKSNFDDSLNREFIEHIAKLIEPGNILVQRGYRTESVRLQGYDRVQPPRAEKVNYQMQSLFDEVNDLDMHPVDRAVLAHLHIERIHPFCDGNGRLGRLVQNLILHQEEYLPAIISSDKTPIQVSKDEDLSYLRKKKKDLSPRVTEREKYHLLLRDAMRGYIERVSDGKVHYTSSRSEMILFDYLAEKISEEYDSVITEIDTMPTEIYEYSGKDAPELYTIKRRLNSLLRHSGKPYQLRLTIRGATGVYKVVSRLEDETREKIDQILCDTGSKSSRHRRIK